MFGVQKLSSITLIFSDCAVHCQCDKILVTAIDIPWAFRSPNDDDVALPMSNVLRAVTVEAEIAGFPECRVVNGLVLGAVKKTEIFFSENHRAFNEGGH